MSEEKSVKQKSLLELAGYGDGNMPQVLKEIRDRGMEEVKEMELSPLPSDYSIERSWIRILKRLKQKGEEIRGLDETISFLKTRCLLRIIEPNLDEIRDMVAKIPESEQNSVREGIKQYLAE